jgi:hypothetical protein
VHVLDQVHLAKCTFANHLHNDEILELDSIAFLLSLENKSTALFHACTCSRFFDAMLLIIIFFLLLIIIIVFVLVHEILALLELLVTDLHVLLQVV